MMVSTVSFAPIALAKATPLCTALIYRADPSIGMRTCLNMLGQRCDRQALDLVLLDQAGDEARFLGVLDELGEIACALGGGLVAADGLLHGRELAVEDFQFGM